MDDEQPSRFSIDLTSTKDAAGIARRFVADHSDRLPADLVADAELLVSELVTNAVLHGAPTISLTVNLDPPLIGVAVRDGGQGLPAGAPQAPADDASHGRGLLLVDRLSSSWGITTDGPQPGKTVWFRLDDEVQTT